jgi:hypothetical protein
MNKINFLEKNSMRQFTWIIRFGQNSTPKNCLKQIQLNMDIVTQKKVILISEFVVVIIMIVLQDSN